MGANRVAAIVIALLLGAYLGFAFDYRFGSSAQFGPGFFPVLLGFAGLAVAVACALSRTATETITGGRKALNLVAILALFAATLDLGGFLLVGIATTAAVMWVFGARRPIEIALVAIAVPIAIRLLFSSALSIPLPEGPLEWILSSAI